MDYKKGYEICKREWDLAKEENERLRKQLLKIALILREDEF